MRWLKGLGLMMALCGAQAYVVSAQTDTLLWGISDSPPFHINDGSHAHKGLCDGLVDEVIRRLPEVNHDIKVFPHTRLSQMLDENKNLCFPCVIKRASSSRFHYSEAASFYPPHGVIARPQVIAKALNAEAGQMVEFAELVKHRELIFAIGAGRLFPDPLQDILNRASDLNQVLLTGRKGTVRVLQSISMKRVDYTLDYAAILKFYQLQQQDENLTFYPVEEMKGNEVLGAIGCTKNEWGLGAINMINRVIPDILRSASYAENLAFWHGLTKEQVADRLHALSLTHKAQSP